MWLWVAAPVDKHVNTGGVARMGEKLADHCLLLQNHPLIELLATQALHCDAGGLISIRYSPLYRSCPSVLGQQ